jgi:hypothetical protein
MQNAVNEWGIVMSILKTIQSQLPMLDVPVNGTAHEVLPRETVFVPFKGSEIFLLHKAFIDAGGAPHENYKTFLEKTVPYISNKTQKGFSAQSFCKYSDKVDPEAKETVKRFLTRMIRNIDSY